jgi:hypothetical protein
MPRHIKFGMMSLLLLAVLGTSYYYNLQQRIREMLRPQRQPPQPYLTSEPVIPKTAPLKKVKLFFPSSSQAVRIEAEEREIRSSDTLAIEAKQIIAELIAGSRTGRLPALPDGTKLRELFVIGELAVVDLTREASFSHPGGLINELSSIHSVVNSLTQNVSPIQSVQILIEGVESETLAGHIDLTQPFREDLSLVSGASAATLGRLVPSLANNNGRPNAN